MDVFSLAAKLMLDSSDFEKGLTEQEGTFKKFGDRAKMLAGGIAKAGSLAFGVVSASFIPIVKNATAAYGEYEQLVGGVETLFKNSAKALQENADKAFQSAGLSANAYMETATSFAASLIQGLGGDTAKAAEYADRAIVDMSDNANKMGTNIEAIQNAYKGFSKQNFTMLDNLKLGYGGTKEEMERLLKDAEKLTGRKFDVSNFADIVDAIHAVQESMDVAGTTAKEASTTIQGSWNATKAAWQNLLVAMADPKGDIKKATESLVNSAETTLKNVAPIVTNVISGIGTAINEIVPVIAEELPGIIEELTPGFLDAGVKLGGSLAKGLANGIKNAAVDWITSDAVVESFDKAVEDIQQVGYNISTAPQRLIDGIFGTDYSAQSDYKRAIERSAQGVSEEWDKAFWASWSEKNGISQENMLIPVETKPEIPEEEKAQFAQEYQAYVEDLAASNPMTIPISYDEFVMQELEKKVKDLSGTHNVTFNVQTNGSFAMPNGSGVLFKPKAKGDWDVPYDNFPALLHRNEMVLTASQARKYRNGNAGNNSDTNALLEAVSLMSASINRLEQKQTMLVMDRQKVGETMNSAISTRQNVLLRGMGG